MLENQFSNIRRIKRVRDVNLKTGMYTHSYTQLKHETDGFNLLLRCIDVLLMDTM